MELEQFINAASDIPTIPVVAVKVLKMIESEGVTAEELAKVVSADAAVAARVLKISNSSFYGCQRQIKTLPHAIMMLGYNTLRSLVVAASVKQVYTPYGLTEKMLWEHSFGAALAARIIAGEVCLVNEEEAFLAGLFHDIGKSILNIMDNRKFQLIMQKCFNENIRFEEAEKQFYNFTHAELGAHVIRKWNFPEMLMQSVLEHHLLDFSDDDDPYLVTLASIVNLANLFCHRKGVGTRLPEERLLLHDSKSARMLQLGEARINSMLEYFEYTFRHDRKFFE